jgi:hypothetical protein
VVRATMRHFLTPSGGRWTASTCRITHCSFGSGSSLVVAGSVLRFCSADGITFDLEDYPSNWESFSDSGLVALLRIATAAPIAPPQERAATI